MQIFVMILAIICEKIALNKPHIVQVTAHIRKRITQIPTADEPEMQKKNNSKNDTVKCQVKCWIRAPNE